MDDPLSALDANVKKWIFKYVLKRKFKNKTRILVTHAIDFLEHVDRIIVMDKGRPIHDGTYEELWDTPTLRHIWETQEMTQVEEDKNELNSSLESSPVKKLELVRK